MSGKFTSFIYEIHVRKQSTEITWNANKKLMLVETHPHIADGTNSRYNLLSAKGNC